MNTNHDKLWQKSLQHIFLEQYSFCEKGGGACPLWPPIYRCPWRDIQIEDNAEDQNAGAACWQSYEVPGWDMDTDSDGYDQEEREFNLESYILSSLLPTNSDPRSGQLNRITPIPSQVVLTVSKMSHLIQGQLCRL